MLSDSAHDLGAALVVVFAGLVGAALVMPAHVQPRASPQTSTPAPTTQAPDPVVRLGVFNAAPVYAWSLARALDAWNTSGARIQFHMVERTKADITVTIAGPGSCGSDPDVAACTQLGYSEPRTIRVVKRLDRYKEARLLAHEVGHIIGLGHDTSGACGAMTPSPWEHCGPAPAGHWRCRLLAEVDIERAIQILGGSARSATGPDFCRTER